MSFQDAGVRRTKVIDRHSELVDDLKRAAGRVDGADRREGLIELIAERREREFLPARDGHQGTGGLFAEQRRER